MRNLLTLSLLVLLSLSLTLPALAAGDPAGTWQGGIELPTGGELGVIVNLSSGEAGWSGSIDIPAQGLEGFALSNVTVEGGKAHFEMAGVPGQPTFDGQLSEAGDTLSGTFRQGAAELPFALTRADEAASETEPSGPALPGKPVPGEGAVGEWLGVLELGPMQLRLALTVEEGEAGLTASLNSVDQGAVIPVDAITFQEGRLVFSIERIQGRFEGKMNEDGSAIEGSWAQGQSRPLTLHRLAEPFALQRPQTPQPPFPYDSRDVTFANEAGGITLAGTLLTPHGDGPFPAVVLVTGSGPQDRDETLMGHKPFLVLADHLARHGIASLRYDDRGAGASEGDHMGSTVDDFAADAAAALAFLAQQPKVRQDALGIIGHSEGGLTGPKVATSHPEIDFLVLLAPPAEPLVDLLNRQAHDVLTQQGVPKELIEKALAVQRQELALVKDASLDAEALREKLLAGVETRRETFTEAERAQLQITDAAIEQGLRVSTSPWFRSLVREDPAVYLKQLKIPVLALFGGKDIQVAAEVNAEILKATLAAAGNESFEVQVFPELNHLFQHAETGAVAEYGSIEETFSAEALDRISTWIVRRSLQ